MEFDQWTIVAVSNGPGILPEEVRMALQYAACELTYRQEEHMLFSDEFVDGSLSTQWKPAALGERTGILFHGLIDYGDWIDCQVNFLMRRSILESGAEALRWMEDNGSFTAHSIEEELPIPDLYRFFDIDPCRFQE